MRMTQIDLLVMLEKEHSLVRAAEKLYISQPSASVAIRELEEELGCLLFERTNRGLKFTPKGIYALEQAKIILRETEKITALCDNFINNKTVKILLGLEREAGKELFSKIVAVLKNESRISVESIMKGREEVIYDVIDKKLDMGIVSLAKRQYEPEIWQMIEDRNVTFQVLQEEDICFLTSSEHPLQIRDTVTLYDVLQFSYVTLKDNRDHYFIELFERLGRDKNITYIDDATSFYKFLQYTQAVSISSKKDVTMNNIRYGRCLKPLLIEKFHFTYQSGILYKPEYINEEMKYFITILEQIMFQNK